MNKPPIGVKPLFILNQERIKELKEAILRYTCEELIVPSYWIEEYNERLSKREQLRKEWEEHMKEGYIRYS